MYLTSYLYYIYLAIILLTIFIVSASHYIGKSFCGALGGACAKFGPEQGRARAPDIRWLEYTPVNLEQLEYTPLQLERHFQH